MGDWMASLCKLSDLEVEMLQKRLAEIAGRRARAEAALFALDAEGVAETLSAASDAQAGWYLAGFRQGLKARRAKVEAELKGCVLEEAGARDALSTAFETQKKYETVAETARVAAVRLAGRRESAALDELALRRTGTR